MWCNIKQNFEYDVIVAGGGPSGCAAATASARQGARTLLLEATYTLGGMGTSGLVGILTTYGDMAPEFGATATLLGIFVVDILVPIVVALAVDRIMRRLNWVKKGDMKLQNI